MALTATVYKLSLDISDIRRNHYQHYNLTLARHPSETEQRLMVRILAFALHASDALQFTRGLSTSDEPDLWEQSLSGEHLHWILLGQPDVKWLKKACGIARHVTVVCYGGRLSPLWRETNQTVLDRLSSLRCIDIDAEGLRQLPSVLARSMSLQCVIQDDHIWLGSSEHSIEVGVKAL